MAQLLDVDSPVPEFAQGVLRMEWPCIPLPGWPNSDEYGADDELAASAPRGRELAQLLDVDSPVLRGTQGAVRPEMAGIPVPSTTDGGYMTGGDFALTAGRWALWAAKPSCRGKAGSRNGSTRNRNARIGNVANVLGSSVRFLRGYSPTLFPFLANWIGDCGTSGCFGGIMAANGRLAVRFWKAFSILDCSTQDLFEVLRI